MDEVGSGYDEQLLAVLTAAVRALQELPGQVHRLTGRQVDAVLPVVDALAQVAAAGRFTLTAEADDRGEIAASTAGTTATWLSERCPSMSGMEIGSLTKAVRELSHQELAAAREAVRAGRLSVPAAVAVAAELRALKPLLDPDPATVPAVLDGLVTMGVLDGPAGVRRVRPALLTRYGLGLLVQDEEDRSAGCTTLTRGRDIGGGIREYRLRLAPAARAVVETAVDTLARPQPEGGPDGAPGSPGSPSSPGSPGSARIGAGRSDLRSDEQRRGDALVELCRRAVGAMSTAWDGSGSPGDSRVTSTVPTARATVLVTIAYDDLITRLRGGTVLGTADSLAGGTGGGLLGPETVRRLACDARLLPAVLDTHGAPLELGRSRRLFSPAQVTAVWLRDRHCTYPGCRAPATWCDAHHLVHWADGGPTDLTNAALLCGRHHTTVHRDRLLGRLAPPEVAGGSLPGSSVVWERDPGSYDRHLARGPTERPAA